MASLQFTKTQMWTLKDEYIHTKTDIHTHYTESESLHFGTSSGLAKRQGHVQGDTSLG